MGMKWLPTAGVNFLTLNFQTNYFELFSCQGISAITKDMLR